MWNTTNNLNKTQINTPSTGIIQKSNQKSFFIRMQNESQLAKEIFSVKPTYKSLNVSVLQVLLMDNSWMLVELVEESEI